MILASIIDLQFHMYRVLWMSFTQMKFIYVARLTLLPYSSDFNVVPYPYSAES